MRSGEIGFYITVGSVALTVGLLPRSNALIAALLVAIAAVALAVAHQG
jgi:hypothetical protein